MKSCDQNENSQKSRFKEGKGADRDHSLNRDFTVGNCVINRLLFL